MTVTRLKNTYVELILKHRSKYFDPEHGSVISTQNIYLKKLPIIIKTDFQRDKRNVRIYGRTSSSNKMR